MRWQGLALVGVGDENGSDGKCAGGRLVRSMASACFPDSPNRILRHQPRLFKRVPLGHKPWKCRTRHHISALFGRHEQYRVALLAHCALPCSDLPTPLRAGRSTVRNRTGTLISTAVMVPQDLALGGAAGCRPFRRITPFFAISGGGVQNGRGVWSAAALVFFGRTGRGRGRFGVFEGQ